MRRRAESNARSQSLVAWLTPVVASRAVLRRSASFSSVAISIAWFALAVDSFNSSGVGSRTSPIQNGKKASAARKRPIV